MWKRSFFLTNDLGVRYVACRSVAFHVMSKLDISKCVTGMNVGMIFLLRHGVAEFLEVYPGGANVSRENAPSSQPDYLSDIASCFIL